MADYSNGSKPIETNAYPVLANGTSGLLSRVEPLITPAKLKSRFLKGIFERLPQDFQYTDAEIKDKIQMAINDLELELKSPIFAEQFKERHSFDWSLYKSYIHIRTQNGPILSIEDLAIVSSNRENIFRLPPEWIDTGHFHQRVINVIPLLAAYGVNTVTGSVANAGIAFLSAMDGLRWVPGYWTVTFTAGFCKEAGKMPIALNNLIGIQTALDILSMIGPSNPNTSVSLGQDGISQATSGPGPQLFQTRIAELQAKREKLLGQLKRIGSQKYYITNI